MLKLLKAIAYGIFSRSGVTDENSVRLIYSLEARACCDCGKTVFGYRYDIPDWYRQARQMGPFFNDTHCEDCHDKHIGKFGACDLCKQKPMAAVCLRSGDIVIEVAPEKGDSIAFVIPPEDYKTVKEALERKKSYHNSAGSIYFNEETSEVYFNVFDSANFDNRELARLLYS